MVRRARVLLLAFISMASCTAVRPATLSFPAQPPATATLQATLTEPTRQPETPIPTATEAPTPRPPTAETTTVNLETGEASDAPVPTAIPEPQRIRFAPGGTGVALSGLLTAWETHSFVLEALAGQDLIIEITAPQPLRLTVSGADGTILRSGMEGADHWQAHLPATQDYSIDLASTGQDAYYQMAITIPAQVVTQPTPEPPVYHDDTYDFEVQMPGDLLAGVSCPVEGILSAAPVASFRLAEGAYAGTNFIDACVVVSVNRSTEALASCAAPRAPNEDYWGQEEINGVRYDVVSHGGVAAGHNYEVISYRTAHAGACYDITLFLHYASIGVYTPGTVAEFDRDAVMGELKDVLYRFRFTGH